MVTSSQVIYAFALLCMHVTAVEHNDTLVSTPCDAELTGMSLLAVLVVSLFGVLVILAIVMQHFKF